MRSNSDLIMLIYAAFNRREIDSVIEMLHPEVDWPNGMEGGRVRGRADVRHYWLRQWARLDPRVEPLHIEDDERGNTIVDVHQVVRDLSGNILIDQMIQHIYVIREGLIERMDIRNDAQEKASG